MKIYKSQIISGGRKLAVTHLMSNPSNPVMLFLHGGPGYGISENLAECFIEKMPLLSAQYNWVFFDQRCAGDSLSHVDFFCPSSVEDYLLDIHTVSKHCISYFQQPKIVLVGHSWGTHIGFKAALRWPENFLSYIGMGQVVDGLAGEKISYEYTLKRTSERFPDCHHSLLEMGPPPHEAKTTFRYLVKQRRALSLTGGFEKAPMPLNPANNAGRIAGLFSAIRLKTGMYLSVKRLWHSCLDVDFSIHQEIPVPVMFICGRYDYVTPSRLVTQWYRNIQSDKKLVVFGGSGHRPHLEEHTLFEEVLVSEKSWLIRDVGTGEPRLR